MGRPRVREKLEPVTVRFKDKDIKRLKEISNLFDLNVGQICRIIVKSFIDDLPEMLPCDIPKRLLKTFKKMLTESQE